MNSERRPHPVLRRVALALLAVAVPLAVLLTAALYSTAAFRFALEAAQPFIPGELHYGKIDGTLAGPARAENITYEVAGTTINAASLEFDISPLALLAGNISLDYVEAKRLVVTLPPPGEPAKDKPPPQPRDVLDALALPVEIRVDDLDVDGFILRAGTDETLLQLETFRTALDWSPAALAITNLDAEGEKLDVAGKLVLGLAAGQASAIDLEGNWRGGAFPVTGGIRGNGNARQLDLAIQLQEPARANLSAQLRDLPDTPAWQGTLHVASVQPSTFRDGLPDAALSGEFRFTGNAADTRIEGTAKGDWPPANGIQLALDMFVNAKRVRVESLQATVDAFDAALSAQGELRYADALSYNASGSISHFAWPGRENLALRDARFDASGNAQRLELNLDASAGENENGRIVVEGVLAFANAGFNITVDARDLSLALDGTRLAVADVSGAARGTPETYSMDLQGRARLNDLPAARFQVHAQGDRQQLSADIDTLQWLDGSARGRVLLAWRNALDVDAQLEASGLALDALDAGIAGRIGGNIHLRAAFGGAKPDIALQIASLDGDIAGEAITGSGSLRLLDGKLMTKGLVVDAGNAHLELDDAVSGFDFRIDVPALGVFHPGVGGQLRASGHFNGELASPTLRVDAAGSGVSWQEWRANAFQLDMEVVRGGEKDSIVQFEGNGIGTPFMEAGQLRMGARGTRGAHRLQMRVAGADTGGNGGLEIALEGAFENSAWRGDIGELRIEHPLAGTWQLAEPQSERILRFEAKTWKIPEHCLLSSSGGSACAGAASQAQGWSTQGALRSVPVAVIAGLLPEGLDYDGAISGNFRVNARQRIEGDASFTLTAGGIRQAAGEGAETLLGWIGGEASVRFRNESAHAQLDIDLVDGGEITGNGRLEMPPGEPSRIDAELRASLDNLRLVPSLVPELSRLEGRVTARLDIEGRLDQPRVRGEAQLRDGRARILALGTDWKNVTLDLAAAGREISMTGHAESGGGHIDIELDAQDTGDGLRGKARLTGENFKAVHTPEANIDISPRLALALQDRDLYIDGSVTVPFARIEPRDLSAAAQPSEDQVIVNAEKRAADDGLRVHVAVTTHLGDDVRVNALGLKAKMDGQLTVTQQPGGPATGNGRLVIVEGEYKAYGQDLTLAKGEIIYTGQPLANPGLDIRAERKPQPDITVGVAVRGPLAQPATTVYSDPPMSETEALAWLLFGRSIEQATGEEEGQISEAAIALGLGGQRLLGRVGRKLGVEEVRVEDVGDPERASLVLGKYLSPDLYVSYGIGLFDAVNSFRIRYRISSKWMLEATSGLKSSADFLYTIER